MKVWGLSRDEAKTLFLAILNGKKVEIEEDDPEGFADFYKGMRKIMEAVIELTPDLHALTNENKIKKDSTYNIEGTAVNYVMCDLENKALMAAFDFLVEEGIEENFYNKLNEEALTTEDYNHAKKLWEATGAKHMRDYHDLYLELDVTLMADCFNHLRKVSKETFGLDVAHYFTLPGYAYDVMLKMTGVSLELLSDIDMLQMVESGIQGGITAASGRYAKANNPYLDDYDETKPTNYLIYLDANNLYGCAMSRYMPIDGFKWVENIEEIPRPDEIDPQSPVGYIMEVDLEYPENLHDDHIDYPFAPESIEINKVRKLVPNLNDKEKYVIHSANLKQYLELGGLKLKKIHRAISLNQSIEDGGCDRL
ncbi:Hypothetical predicted protein [Mytilus galloprovincialis]|uniref:DNA-directed DNA polymerase n=1 Tax=Mytilus galloprovincialis TaxID=29158 RepID=A0A8B6FT02_MYTGA|nr:Hypothetical predicted protein [Mytilus galloprovincialis]